MVLSGPKNATGGDGIWTPIADGEFRGYADVLAAYAAHHGLTVSECC